MVWPFVGPHDNAYINNLYGALRSREVTLISLNRRELRRGGADVLHLQWPEYLIPIDQSKVRQSLRALTLLVSIAFARRHGVGVVWTIHNRRPHDPALRTSIVSAFLWMLGALVDRTINLTTAGAHEVRATHRWARRCAADVIPQGAYVDSYPALPSREEARLRFGINLNARVLLQFGQLRRNKRTAELVDEFRRLASGDDVLVIAGQAHNEPALVDELVEAASDDVRIRLLLRFVTDEEVSALHAAADVVVLPYDATNLNSSAAILGVSLKRPVVLLDSPVTRELADTIGSDWVHLFRFDVADAVKVALSVESSAQTTPPNLEAMSWSSVGDRTLEVYRKAIEQHSHPASSCLGRLAGTRR